MLALRAPISSCRVVKQALSKRLVLAHTSVARKPRCLLVRASTETQNTAADVTAKIEETLTQASKTVQAKWAQTEDKPAAIIVVVAALVSLYAVSSVVDAVDKIPVVSSLFELIGLAVSGWLAFRLLTAESDRKELLATVEDFIGKVTGQKSK